MPSRREKRRSTRGKTVGIVIGALLVIVAGIVVTLVHSGNLDLSLLGFEGRGGSGSSYRNVTLTDAQLICEAEARNEFGERIKFLTFDRHSSRYDEKANRYKMYFSLDVTPKKNKAGERPVEYLVNCFVHGSRGNVTHYASVENREEERNPNSKKGQGLFGF